MRRGNAGGGILAQVVKTKAMTPPPPPEERMAAFLEVEDDEKAETEAAKLLVSPKKRKAKEVVKKRKATVVSDSDSEDDEEARKQQEREKAQQQAREKVDQCQDERAKGREELKEVWKEMRKIGDDKKLTPHDAMRALHAVMLSATSVRTPCSPPSSKSPRRRTQPRLGNSRAAAVGMDATRQEPVRTILVQQCIKQPPEQLKAFAEDRELLVMVNDWLVECRDDGTTGGAAALISNTVRAPKLEIVVGRARDATDGQLGVRSLFVAAVLESNPESRALRRGRVTAVTGSCGCCCGYRWIRSRRFARRGCLTRCDASAPTTPSTRSARWLSKWPRSGRPSRRPPRLPRRP